MFRSESPKFLEALKELESSQVSREYFMKYIVAIEKIKDGYVLTLFAIKQLRKDRSKFRKTDKKEKKIFLIYS